VVGLLGDDASSAFQKEKVTCVHKFLHPPVQDQLGHKKTSNTNITMKGLTQASSEADRGPRWRATRQRTGKSKFNTIWILYSHTIIALQKMWQADKAGHLVHRTFFSKSNVLFSPPGAHYILSHIIRYPVCFKQLVSLECTQK
jgi:hypothetical protein